MKWSFAMRTAVICVMVAIGFCLGAMSASAEETARPVPSTPATASTTLAAPALLEPREGALLGVY